MNNFFVTFGSISLLTFILSGCIGDSTKTASEQLANISNSIKNPPLVTPIPSPKPINTPSPTSIPTGTITPRPSLAPMPTPIGTAKPSITPIPTPMATPTPTTTPINIQQKITQGKTSYNAQCMVCHGANAVTANTAFQVYRKYKALPEMTKYINDTMPLGNAKACINECAENTAYYILSIHNPNALIPTPTVTPQPTPTPVATPKPSVIPTITPRPTGIPGPSPTPARTPVPTSTPVPTPVPNIIPFSYSPLRRLSHEEYSKTIKSLLGATVNLNSFPVEKLTNGYIRANEQITDTPYLEAYLNNAYQITTQLNLKVETFTGCSLTSSAFKTCLNSFLSNFGNKVYRRPLSSTELTSFIQLYDQVAALSNGDTAIMNVVVALISSPSFLYIVEDGIYSPTPTTSKNVVTLNIGQPANIKIIKLDSYEVATRLSYLIMDDTPDSTLLSAAARDELLNPTNVLQHFDRLMQISTVNQNTSSVLKQLEGWMGIKSSEKIASNVNLTIDQAKTAYAQASMFLRDWFFQNKELSSLYNGSINVSLSQDATDIDASQNLGILGSQAFLASHTHGTVPPPITRGVFTIENLLCQNLPSPPANVGAPPAQPVNATTREWLALHRKDPSCSGCHNLIDPYGIVYEEFNAKGQMRKFDNGNPVDASTELPSIKDITGNVQGLNSFANLFANSNAARECAAEFWYQNTFSRNTNDNDENYLNVLNDQWKKSGGSAKNLLREIVKSQMFYVRVVD